MWTSLPQPLAATVILPPHASAARRAVLHLFGVVGRIVVWDQAPGAELFVYPGSSHLFAEPGDPDYDDEAARLATERVLAFLSAL